MKLWSDQIMKRHSKYLKTVASWYQELVPRIVHFLRTRVIRISLPKIDEPISQQTEGRHRHKNNALSQMLMFGLVAAGLIVIPMGFQFLAVLGGKALLLAKLALILTSIQGLKKIATSNVNYGLYSTGYASPWQYDRKWPYEGDQYSSTLLTAPVAEHYHPLSSVLPSHYPNLNPRGEDYLGT
ncbi:hypothetical protein ABEB36_005185 [Hypothenemus hampei]|uniref:Uncharacterized protein n=1 Tax=Hypothenemus hampei TaxID=57062 RepID=A0ABD1F161_HYPHA